MKSLITVLESNYPVQKKFDMLGKKLKGNHFSTGSFITYTIFNMTQLRNLIEYLQQFNNKCLMLGRFKEQFEGSIVTKAMKKKSSFNTKIKTRTKADTQWNETTVFVFDYDYTPKLKDSMKAQNFEELYNLILKIFPEFENVEMLFKYSSSSNIYDINKNQYVSEKIGIHVFFIVTNTNSDTVANFVSLLKSRLIKLDLYEELNNEIEYLFDMSVFSQERELITSKPQLASNLAVYEVDNEMRIFNEGKKGFDLNSINTQELVNINRTSKQSSLSLNIDTNRRLNYLAIIVSKLRPNYKTVLAFLDGYIVSMILQDIGYNISGMKFKLRNEKTASASIKSDDGLIKDFGGDFAGSILKLLTEYHNLNFKQARDYLYICFGAKINSPASFNGLKSPYEINKNLYKNIELDMNLEIPKIQEYKSKARKIQQEKKSINLSEIATGMTDGLIDCNSEPEIIKIFGENFFNKYSSEIFNLYILLKESTDIVIGYCHKYRSLSIILYEESEIKTIAVRRNNSENNEEWTKWKKYGSINYIPKKIIENDNRIFIAFGMMEVILFEILNLSYIVFQSDSIANSLSHHNQAIDLKLDVIGKEVVIFCDNDESCKKASLKVKNFFTGTKSTKIVDFQEMVSQKLDKGYDLIDYIRDNGLNILNR